VKPPVYYNENDPFAAAWLRNLIAANLIAPGDVDERSIVDVGADDFTGYVQCHFFAGIAGWAYALRLAGWPDDRPCWTGSVPCQPLSSAGQRRGHLDRRHLWPAFYALIAECRPATLIGEQVASADGREWLAGIRVDLEHLGYAIGCADLPAAGVGAPHIRQRLFWVADAAEMRRSGRPETIRRQARRDVERGDSWLGDADAARSQGRREHAGKHAGQFSAWASGELIGCLDGKARRTEPGIFPLADGISNRVGRLRAYGNAIVPQVAAEFIGAVMDAVTEHET
jgi:DNA (cytosine-5)-methyltransferase 1